MTERVDLAYQAFFRRVKAGEKEAGYPRFRGKGWYDSFTFKQSGFKLDGDRLTLSKIGDIRIKLHRPICAAVKTLTIQRDAVGNWYACFSCECEPTPLEPTPKVVGVDLGLTTFAYMSDGEKIARQRWMKQDAKDIARLQRKKEQFVKGQPERRKVIHALCHAYERAANRRSNFAHQESRKLVNEYQFIAFEKLDIQEMQSTGTRSSAATLPMSPGVNSCSSPPTKLQALVAVWHSLTPEAQRKCVPAVMRLFPKTCLYVSMIVLIAALKLNRDHNAALNILARGLASISAGSPVVAVEAHD